MFTNYYQKLLQFNIFIFWFWVQEDDARVKRAFQTLLIYVGNIVKNPNEEKYRKIRLGNPLFQVKHSSWHLYVNELYGDL